jgi:hypothetical protein
MPDNCQRNINIAPKKELPIHPGKATLISHAHRNDKIKDSANVVIRASWLRQRSGIFIGLSASKKEQKCRHAPINTAGINKIIKIVKCQIIILLLLYYNAIINSFFKDLQ